jgi:mannose-6-phosphate isomerase-like protein (cupin superfamily)
MSRKIESPTIVQAAGNKPKVIEEFIGRVNTGTETVSIARMKSPSGWHEPGQTPEFDEYTVVLKGTLQVETKDYITTVSAGEAVIAPKGKWVRYGTPAPGGGRIHRRMFTRFLSGYGPPR